MCVLMSVAGTTCLVALLSDKQLTVANVGDSRGVLCDKDGNTVPLSHDHKPYQLRERKRIKQAGESRAQGNTRPKSLRGHSHCPGIRGLFYCCCDQGKGYTGLYCHLLVKHNIVA